MAMSSRAVDVDSRRARVERILDAAGELLLRWGYKRVTIDDVATEAGIGKGTVYLHWTTREALFHAVLARELTAAIDDLLEAVRADHATALLHRLIRTWFCAVGRRPLVRAAIMADLDTLGKLARHADQVVEKPMMSVFAGYLEFCVKHGLIRPDLKHDEVVYALRATVRGFFLTEALAIEPSKLPQERKAELLSATLHRAFETEAPPQPGAVDALAELVVELFGGLAERLRGELCTAYK